MKFETIKNFFEIKDNDSWVKAELLNIVGETTFLFKDCFNNKEKICSSDQIRLIIDELAMNDFPNHFMVTQAQDELKVKALNSLNEWNVFYIPCIKRKQLGNFFSVEVFSKDGARITQIAAASDIRRTNFILLKDLFFANIKFFKDESIKLNTQLSKISDDLTVYNSIIKSVKESLDKPNLYICFFSDSKQESYIRFLCLNDDSYDDTFKFMLEMAIENELNLLKIENESKPKRASIEDNISNEKDSQNYSPVPSDLNKSQTKYEFSEIQHLVPKQLVGILIGSQGRNIQRIKKEYKVEIQVLSNIPGDSAQVIIKGDQVSISKCLQETKITDKSVKFYEFNEPKVKKVLLNSKLYKFEILRENTNKSEEKIKLLNIIGTDENIERCLEKIKQYLI